MSTSVPPRDANASGQIPVNSSAIADEQALKRLFDAEFASYIESAKSQLGDAPGLASRVVETAFVNTWNQRDTLRDAAQVKILLTDEVRHGSARALSRRASAARFGGQQGAHDKAAHAGAGTVDPAKSWAEIEKNIHGGGSSGAAHAAVASSTRHEAAAHMKSVGKGRSWVIPVISIVVLLAALAAVGVYVDRMGEDDAILSSVASVTVPVIQSNYGQLGNTTLTDGSKLRIGPETKVFEPDGFPSKNHAIRLDGTAKFDVTPVGPKELPFRVIAHRTHFIATGTSFVISAYPEDSSASLSVLEGSVTVKNDKTTQVVPAGQMLVVDATGMHAPTDAQKEKAFGWVDGRVTSNKKLRDALATLIRWFNMEIKVPDLQLLDRDASFTVPLDSSRAAIAQIEKSANVKFGYEGETKAFRDAGAKGAAPAAKPAAAKPAAKPAAGKKKK